jgi:hypothetical protein
MHQSFRPLQPKAGISGEIILCESPSGIGVRRARDQRHPAMTPPAQAEQIDTTLPQGGEETAVHGHLTERHHAIHHRERQVPRPLAGLVDA